MKKIIKNITVILLAAILLINSSGVNVFAKNYSFSGTYTGHNLNSGEKTKIVLKKIRLIRCILEVLISVREK